MATTERDKIEMFFKIIKEDISLIKEEHLNHDKKLDKDEYAFNYWVLSKLYNVEDDCISSQITEYNDKSIDCFVHFPDSKELYIIQNKYYYIDNGINPKDLSDFLNRPLSCLYAGNFDRCKELQEIFTSAIEDPEYKILFHFYTTSATKEEKFKDQIEEFNRGTASYGCYIEAKY
ncbi:MAG: hypothetical protein IJD04_05525 [Desulfovibrionaceae bacterium]|nr:hypothetical protein [Desulfovibrionaceae bacterium]